MQALTWLIDSRGGCGCGRSRRRVGWLCRGRGARWARLGVLLLMIAVMIHLGLVSCARHVGRADGATVEPSLQCSTLKNRSYSDASGGGADAK